jgi:hypothetical protein
MSAIGGTVLYWSGGGCSLLRTILKAIRLLLNEKFKIERQNEGKGSFLPSFPGLNRMGK